MPESLKPCEVPTKRQCIPSVGWINEPGKCDNIGRFSLDGVRMCKKHLNAIERKRNAPPSELDRLRAVEAVARQVAEEWDRRDRIDLITSNLVKALDALAQHFKEPHCDA